MKLLHEQSLLFMHSSRPIRRCTATSGGSGRSDGEVQEEAGRSVVTKGYGSVVVCEWKCALNDLWPLTVLTRGRQCAC